MMTIQKYLPLVARILLSLIFIKSGIGKMLNPDATQQFMEAKGIPFAGVLLIPTILILIVGGLSILLGYKARLGALLLIGFLIPATLIFHFDFPEQEVNFLKNLGLMGGLMMIVAFGSGEISLDHPHALINNSSKD